MIDETFEFEHWSIQLYKFEADQHKLQNWDLNFENASVNIQASYLEFKKSFK